MAPKRNQRNCKSCKNSERKNVKNVRGINKFCDCVHPAAYNRKDRIHRVRTRDKKLNIPKLVYKFLGNVASLETPGNNEAKKTRSRSKRSGNKKSKKSQRSPEPVHVSTKNVDESRTSVSTSRSAETNSTICTVPSTPVNTNSGIKTRQKFSIQAIKDYIRAGIAEGKRRAKRYMCKALSFGVDTGYLIPTDSDGQVLRVSSALISFTSQKDDDVKDDERGRGIRKKLRSGNGTCTSEERKVLRRRGAPMPQKRPRSPSSVPSSTSSSTKPPPRPKTKKPRYGKRTKKQKNRSGKRGKLKRGSGRPRGRISSAKMKLEKSCSNEKLDKRESCNVKGKKEENQLGEETLTPSRSEEDNTKSIKKENLSDPSIEENCSEGSNGAKEN